MLLMYTWRRGSRLLFEKSRKLEFPLADLVAMLEKRPPQRVPGTARVLTALASEGSAAAGLELLMDKIKHTRSNDEFLAEIAFVAVGLGIVLTRVPHSGLAVPIEVGIGLAFGGAGSAETGVIDALDPALFEERVGVAPGAGVQPGAAVVRIDPRYFRPTEVDLLIGDARKAARELKWTPRRTFHELIGEMVRQDLALCARDATRATGRE